MKTIFKNETVSVELNERNLIETISVSVNSNNSQALFSLACEVKRLQEQLAEAHTNLAQPLPTLEVTSEPREYHVYAEHRGKRLSMDTTFSANNVNFETGEDCENGFIATAKKEISGRCWKKTMIKTNPKDWVIKSLSRL